MGENEDFIVDKNGILLDYSPGTLHLDENGIVQDTDYSTLQITGDYEDTQLSLYDSQPYQSFTKNGKLDDQSWYCISDLEISDDEKDVQSSLGNFTPAYSGRPNAYKGQVENSKVTPANQIFDYGYDEALNSNYPIQPTYYPPNYETPHEVSQYIYNDEDHLNNFTNQPISSFQPTNNGGITNYQTPVPIGTMYDYQKRDLLAVSASSSKSSLSIPEGLTASERDLYLQHANTSQILDSSHNESYQLEVGHQAQQEDEDDVDDDELFLITGHIDFDSHQTSRPGSANVLENSSGLGHEIRKVSEGNGAKSRVAKRSVSFDLLPQEQSFNPNEQIPSFAGNVQENKSHSKRSRDQGCESNQGHPEQNNSERHSNQLQEMNKEPNFFFNPDISLNSELNSVNRNGLVRNKLNSSYPQYFSDESSPVPEDQEIPTFPKYSRGQSTSTGGGEFQKDLNESQNTMNKSDNIEIEEGSLSKSKTDDSVKSFRAKSKSTTNIRSPSTPVKSKYKSLSELSNITDGDDEASNLKLSFSIKDLNSKLEEELSKRKKATEIVAQLQSRYDNLLTRYADAEMMIDELRIGSKMAPKISDFKSSQSPITNLIMNRALVTSTPMASTYSMNQSTREDDDRMPLSGNLNLNNAERNSKTKEQNNQENSKSAKIKADLIVQANNLESKMNTLVTLLEKGQLTSKEVKKVFDNIKSEQDKQRREYLRVKEEFQRMGSNSDEVFDKDKELEGYLFQLQMRFDELEDKHKHLQENQKEPFQETEEQVKQTITTHEKVEDSQIEDEDEAEKKRQKFLSQYKSLMDRYHRLKISGSLNENDEEVKEIKKKLQVISEELCLNQHQQRLTMRSPNADSEMIQENPKKTQGSAQASGQNVSLQEGIHKTNTMISSSPAQQKPTSSHPKKSGKRGNRIIRSLPAPPKESGEPSNKKSDEVSSTTSVPDSGIFEELNGTSHRHPSVTNKMRLASLKGQKVQSRGPVHTESSDGPAIIDDSPRVPVGPNRRRNSLGLAEVSSQSTGPASLNSQGHGDDSLLWQPATTSLHGHYSSQGRSTESEPIDEYSSENSDQTDLDTSERFELTRKARPKSILRRKYKTSKIRPSSSERIDQKSERSKHKTSADDSVTEHRERSRNSVSDFDKTDRKKQRQRSQSLDPPKTKSSEQPPVIKSSNKEKLKNLQLEIESLKARFNNGIPWKNARVTSNAKHDTYSGENSSAGTNLPSYPNQAVFPSSPNIYHDNFPQQLQYQTTVRSSLEEVHWKNPSLANSHRSINNFVDSSNYQRINNSNPIITPSEPPTTFNVQKNQNTSVTLLDYHSPTSQIKTFQRTPSQKSPVLSESEHRSNSFYLSNHNNNNMQFLSPARSFQDCSQTQTDHNLRGSQLNLRQYSVSNQSLDYHRSTNSLAPEPVWTPHRDQFVFNSPHRNHSPYRAPTVPLHSNTTLSQSSYSPVPNVVKRNPILQFSRSCTPIPHSVAPVCDICGIPGCSHNYVTEVNHTYPTQGGTHPVPAPPYSVYNSQNIPSPQRNHSNYRNYQLPDDDLNDSINIAERTIEDINHLTRKMMRTMHEELTKSKRNYDHFYPFY